MSTEIPTPEPEQMTTPAGGNSHTPHPKPQRVLACVLCQQRKIKCDRKFPCSNCTKSNSHCVPAGNIARPQRRRRFPERELLDRLRRYESLLRENDIVFEPLHKTSATAASNPKQAPSERGHESADEGPSPATTTTTKTEHAYKTKKFWHAIDHRPRDSDDDSSDGWPDEIREAVTAHAWNMSRGDNEHLLFPARKMPVDLSFLHPDQVHIFKLWQTYLDNVNPLLKVTHTPTLQGRIINAAGNLTNASPPLSALMFGIYCMATLSLTEDECLTSFGSPKEDLLTKYQFGCLQALYNCNFLRSSDRDCLTALYFYLFSIRTLTEPQSLSSMLGIAIRIAQRMGLPSEASHAKCSALDAEMRRRLWWALVMYDTRICEMSDYTTTVLVPTWDCKPPLNVNDFDLQPETKESPQVQATFSEALFAVVRGEMGDFIRNSSFHLDFTIPALKAIAKDVQKGPTPGDGELTTLEKIMEEKYLRLCNPESPLHFMLIWTTRGFIAKCRLVETRSKLSSSSSQITNAQRDSSLPHAIHMIEYDTTLMNSSLIKHFHWFLKLYFPFPAFIHLVQELKRRPTAAYAEVAWKTMGENYEARELPKEQTDHPFFKVFAKVVMQAWEGREPELQQSKEPVVQRMIADMRQRVAQQVQSAQMANMQRSTDALSIELDQMISGSPNSRPMMQMGGYAYGGMQQAAPGVDVNQLDWNAMDWNNTGWDPMNGGCNTRERSL